MYKTHIKQLKSFGKAQSKWHKEGLLFSIHMKAYFHIENSENNTIKSHYTVNLIKWITGLKEF